MAGAKPRRKQTGPLRPWGSSNPAGKSESSLPNILANGGAECQLCGASGQQPNLWLSPETA
eukprot:11161439-Lingulodinium_polyedra.AAC.1